MEQGGSLQVVQSRGQQEKARGQGGGGAGTKPREAGAEGREAGGPRRVPADHGQGSRRGQGGGGPQPRPNLPRCNLEVREHSACLLMDSFQTLSSVQEIADWLEGEV